MKVYLREPDCTVYTHTVEANLQDLVSPFDARDYACLVALGTPALSDGARRHIARELIRTNCRYVVLFGPDYDPLLRDLIYANAAPPAMTIRMTRSS